MVLGLNVGNKGKKKIYSKFFMTIGMLNKIMFLRAHPNQSKCDFIDHFLIYKMWTFIN